MVIFGDVAQLPPIGTTLFTTAFWKNNFKTFLLKEIERHTNPHFIATVTNLCVNELFDKTLIDLQSRKASFDAMDPLTTTIIVSLDKS